MLTSRARTKPIEIRKRLLPALRAIWKKGPTSSAPQRGLPFVRPPPPPAQAPRSTIPIRQNLTNPDSGQGAADSCSNVAAVALLHVTHPCRWISADDIVAADGRPCRHFSGLRPVSQKCRYVAPDSCRISPRLAFRWPAVGIANRGATRRTRDVVPRWSRRWAPGCASAG